MSYSEGWANVPQTPLATLQGWLIDARQAYQDLMTGAAVVEIVADGYMTKYRIADADKLRAYIGRLENQIAGRGRPSGVGFTF
jgi:hypothetical protein